MQQRAKLWKPDPVNPPPNRYFVMSTSQVNVDIALESQSWAATPEIENVLVAAFQEAEKVVLLLVQSQGKYHGMFEAAG